MCTSDPRKHVNKIWYKKLSFMKKGKKKNMVNWGLGNFDRLKQLKPPKVANK